MPASAYVDRNEQQREYSDIAHVRTGPPHRASPNPAQQQRSGKTGELADRIQIANQLKITPPVLNLGSRPATPVQARQTLPQDNGDLRGRPIFKQPRPSKLDDTESIRSTTTGDPEYERQDNFNEAEEEAFLQRRLHPDHIDKYYGPTFTHMPHDWRERAENERAIFERAGMAPYLGRQDFLEGDSQDNEVEDRKCTDEELDEMRPHERFRAPVVPPTNKAPMGPPLTKPQHSVGPFHNRQPTALHQPNAIRPQVQKEAKMATTAESSSDLSSDDELPRQAPVSSKTTHITTSPGAIKRPLPDETPTLDFDLPVLQSMSWSNLEQHPFSTDPRDPNTKPVHEAPANQLTLQGKLVNMPRMSSPDIRSMFACQTDTEREETGEWFMTQLREMMKQLLDNRVQKRQVSMKFEDEIKRQLAAVEKKEKEVESDLAGLKRGGTELIQDRRGGRRGSADTDVI